MTSAAVPVAKAYDGSADEAKLVHDHKRELDYRHKYTRDTSSMDLKLKKKRVRIYRSYRMDPAERAHRQSVARSKFIDPDIEGHESCVHGSSSSSSSSEDDGYDADITYSYDAKRGPSRGSEILGMAINRAVERYESKATEKLVRDEYEVVQGEAEMSNDNSYNAVEDGYEFV